MTPSDVDSTVDSAGPDPAECGAAEDRAVEEYLRAFARGEAEDLDAFCERHGDATGELRRRLEGFAAVLSRSKAPGEVEAAPSPPPDLSVETLGDFRPIRPLGEGGMGVVYLAEQISLGRLVALKVSHPGRGASPEAEARFRREAQALARLRHPNVVAVYATGAERGVRYVAMELVPGEGLDERLREAASRGSPVPIRAAVRWIALVARALQAAHDLGVIHRDVKPSNVRITPEGRPVLLDFGLARDARSADLTLSGEFRGTPHYASPEQVAARPVEIGPATDVYSLGVTLYECVTGRVPFEGETTEQVFHQILSREPTSPRRLNPAIPRDLETAILRAVEKEPSSRYATAAAFAEDLEAILELRTVRARPAGALTRSLKWARRNRPAALAGGVTFLAVLAGISAWIERRVSTDRAFEREVGAGERALSESDFPAALAAYDRALGLRPEDGKATRRRSEVVALRERDLAERAIDRARRDLGEYRALRASVDALRSRVESENARFNWERMNPEERGAFLEAKDALAAERLRLEEAFAEVTDALNLAARHDPENASLPDLRAEAYLERWEAALVEGDRIAEALFRRRVEQNDLSGKWRARLDEPGRVTLAGSADGAEVHLFRYELLSRLRPGGERRLVPAPFHPAKGLFHPPIEDGDSAPDGGAFPGDVLLQVEAVEADSPAGRAGVLPGDLVLRYEGLPIEGVLLVGDVRPDGPASSAGLRPFDRLVRIGGSAIQMEDDLLRAYATDYARGDLVEAVFARGGREIRVEARKTAHFDLDFRLALVGPEGVLGLPAPDSGYVLTIFSGGASREVRVDPGLVSGLRTSRTASPLMRLPGHSLGRLPIQPFTAPPGSYLCLVHKQGFEDSMVPLLVERGAEVEARIDLLDSGSTPDGFVWVPPGPFLAGGDPDAPTSWRREKREVAGYWISRREMTRAEYLEFLNDPATIAEIDREARQERRVREPRFPEGPVHWIRRAGDRFVLDDRSGYAVASVDWEDADAYCKWRTARGRARGEPWIYDLPTEEEWEKAARGVDGRTHPWGDVFDWGFCKGDLSAPVLQRQNPLLRAVRDASPFGVFDMAGGMTEWCGGKGKYSKTRPVRGGSWAHENPQLFRSANRDYYNQSYFISYFGFRLVARPPA